MQILRKRIVMIAVMILVVAVAGGVSATLVMAAGAPKERPFSATQQGTFAAFDDPETEDDNNCAFLNPPTFEDTLCSIALEGSGTATHLGSYSETANWLNTVNLGVPCGEMGTTNVTLTAANGDEIYAVAVLGVASICPAGPPDENGVVLGMINDAPFEITGGSGRFEGASGSFVRSGSFEQYVFTANGIFDVTYEGTITY